MAVARVAASAPRSWPRPTVAVARTHSFDDVVMEKTRARRRAGGVSCRERRRPRCWRPLSDVRRRSMTDASVGRARQADGAARPREGRAGSEGRREGRAGRERARRGAGGRKAEMSWTIVGEGRGNALAGIWLGGNAVGSSALGRIATISGCRLADDWLDGSRLVSRSLNAAVVVAGLLTEAGQGAWRAKLEALETRGGSSPKHLD